MGDAELLLAELEELKALLGDDYLSVDARPQQKSAARVCTPKRAPKKQPQKRKDADAVEHSPQEAHLPQAPLLERIHEAQKRNEALASVLKAQLAQVERQLVDSDHVATTIRQAQAIDRNVGKQAGGAQQFSWTVRHSEAARGCSRLLAATGMPAPPHSTFWAHSGKAPAPNETSKALTKLFWRNPAAARPPRTWNKHEEQCLLTAVRCINVANRRAALVQSYREQVDAGADASALKSELARQLEALPAHGSMEEAAPGAGGIGDCAEDDLHDASTFSIMDWQSVAQQVGDRKADDCAVHYSSHIKPRLQSSKSEQQDRDLTPDEQRAILAAVEEHGRRSWPQVSESCGLNWQPWRLLQAFWQAAAAADAAQDAHAQTSSAGMVEQARMEAGGEGEEAGQPSVVTGSQEQGVDGQRAKGLGQGTNRADGNGSAANNLDTSGSNASRAAVNVSGVTGLGANASDVHLDVNAGVTVRPRYWQWPEALDEKLLKVMEDLLKCPWAGGDLVSWMHVAFMVREGVTGQQCKLRFSQLQHIQRHAGPFTAQESANVVAAVRKHGQDWNKVARAVPGRTPKQCGDHFMIAASRPARDFKHLWTPEIKREFFRMRVKHSRGSRQMHWPGIAADLSELCGVRLSVEDVRKKSRALVRQLTAHGMPPGYSLAQQQEYVQAFPDAIEARQDRMRASLHAWGAENGINIRRGFNAADANAGGANSAAAVQASSSSQAQTPGSHAAASGSTQAERTERLNQLLQQTRYLRFLDETENEGGSPDAAEETPGAESLDNAPMLSSPSGKFVGGRAADVLKSVSAVQHPTAAALRTLLLSAEYATGAGAEASTAPTARDVECATQPNPNPAAPAQHMAAGPSAPGTSAAARAANHGSAADALNGPLAQMLDTGLEPTAPSNEGGRSTASASAVDSGSGPGGVRGGSRGSASTGVVAVRGIPQQTGALPAGEERLESRVRVPHTAAASGSSSQQQAAARDASIHATDNMEDCCAHANGCAAPGAATTQSAQLQSDIERPTAPLLQGDHVAGMLAEGRWIQYVKVNHAQRRARIAFLQSAKRLRVHLIMPKLREEHGIAQGGEQEGQEQRPQNSRAAGRRKKNTRAGPAAEAPEEAGAAPLKRARASAAQDAAEGSEVAAGKRKKQTRATTGPRKSSRTALQSRK